MADKKGSIPRGQLIRSYASAMVGGLIGKIEASAALRHRLAKGELRELFVSDLLRPFLTVQFGVGSGVIINQAGSESRQTDIIIYDTRILPPFIQQSHIGVYPAESVVATIEVKSQLSRTALLKAERDAKNLIHVVYDPEASAYGDYDHLRPLCAVFGCYGNGIKEIASQSGQDWLTSNIESLFALCLLGKYSWLRLEGKGWTKSSRTENYEETKRFLAAFADNTRTHAEQRLKYLSQFEHYDWIGLYIREPINNR